MATYIGFSTTAKNGMRLTDQELINRDLMNHIYTVRGERVMMPGFGTRIPLIVFEPLDPITLEEIEKDLREVIDYDPRVQLIDIAVTALPDNNAVVAFIDLKYVELNLIETLRLEFPTGG